jgi:signal transduction histidine kinase
MGRLTAQTRLRSLAFVSAAVGVVATVVAASAAAMSARDALELTALGAGTAALGGIAAGMACRSGRGRSIATQAVAMSVIVVATVALGAWVGARAMFLSAHDLHVLVVLLCAAGTVGVTSTLLVGDRIGRANTALIDATRRLGTGEPAVTLVDADRVGETARLARELEIAGRRLAEARAREQAIDASRRELVAWISHDLRTPLSGLRAIAEALEDGVVADDTSRYYALLREETERLTALVDDLFELSRTQAGVLRLELQRVQLGDVVSDALAVIAPVARAKGVRLEGRLPDGLPLCNVAPSELQRALRNLLENAVRHTPHDGTVIVEARVDGDATVVSVIDDGGGIPVADLPRVFDAGFRGDRARTGDAGAGLGLAITKGIVEAHQGEIAVHNENGGARFTIRLPLGADPR